MRMRKYCRRAYTTVDSYVTNELFALSNVIFVCFIASTIVDNFLMLCILSFT